ncbi:preprotein translocase subunit SecG [Pseudaeromonas paramecii]|uniref:Protein-export membrane protein SecG n=1 Tax=Pseudaeromonas paramecii TaxID=2138166 RepID=A0ABP8Q1A2_9GAMM
MYEILLVLYLLISLALIGLVLIQHGKGAGMGASFGAGASNTVFGSAGSGNFLTRTTAILAAVFFVISLVLGAMTNQKLKPAEDWSNLDQAQAEQVAPVAVQDSAAQNTDVPN